MFTVLHDPTHETRGYRLEEGMKLRLEGPKQVLDDIKAHEASMIEITGLMKQSDTVRPGVGLAGGRVRITPVMPSGRSAPRDPGPPTPVIDVESFQQLTSSCPSR